MRTVEAKARNRPIKIAYLVPHEETPVNHMIVEAVFREAYTRWAGAYTLVIPTRSIGFMHSEYEAWLSSFDPDFVYTFLELDPALIRTIDKLCSPISLIRHNPQNGEPRWQSFIPDWGLYFEPISSITTVPSPYTQPTSFTPREIEPQVTIATQYAFGFKSRFMTDNFGGGFQVGGMTYGIAGLYETICLVPPELPKNNFAGNSRCTSLADMLTNINLRKAIPVAVYAMAHSEAISTVQPYRWTRSFNLFIGSTVLDRIHFWNARHFTPRHAAGCLGSLILEADVLNDGDLVAQLGKYLDNHNFSGHISSPAQVSIRSYSHSEQELHPIKELLQKHTYNSVFVNSEFNLPAIPAIEDFQEPYVQFIEPVESSTLKLTEKNNTLAAKEPSHFMYVPPRHRGLARGQWIIELDIERHNSSSKYSNINSWVLPTRRQLIGAFTDNLGKVTKNHRLAVLPITKGFHTSRQSINKDYFFSLTLPDDETFFQHLLLDGCRYTQHDLRLLNAKVGYRNLTISDKGQNLRGVVSMFDNLTIAHEVLTIRFWREVLRAAKVESVKHLIFTRKQLEGFLPNDQATLDILRRELDWSDPKKVTQYLKSNLTDTLEYLVSINVFFCVHQWRCRRRPPILSSSYVWSPGSTVTDFLANCLA